jgi:hypothetical protein
MTHARTKIVVKTAVGLLLAFAGCSGLEQPMVIAPERLDAAAAADRGDPAPDVAAVPDLWVNIPEVNPAADAGDAAEPLANDVVYAHSGSDLFRVDPETLAVTRIGPFILMEAGRTRYLNTVTDIAVDRARRIVGLTYTQLLEIDGATGTCTAIAPLPMGQRFNGLSWIRGDGPELLVATSVDGGVFRIDPLTGAATSIGQLGGGLRSSGDLVSVQGYGTLMTVQGPGRPPTPGMPGPSDRLAKLDPATGAATIIGDIGFGKVWGLGFWKNKVFGFTSTGGFILIDPVTAKGNLVRTYSAFPFYGAGVTTSVPVVIVD